MESLSNLLFHNFISADQDKVQALMESIQEIGLQEPVGPSVKQQCLHKPLLC